MPEQDCSICEKLRNCGATISDPREFYTLAIRLLCEQTDQINTISEIALGNVEVVQATPTIETSSYTENDVVGELITLVGATALGKDSGLIISAAISDLDAEAADIDVVFFNENPSASTFTDNAVFDPADADLPKIAGIASITTHWSFNDNSFSQEREIGIPINTVDQTLYAVLVMKTSGGVTYTSASDLTLSVGILQD